MMGTMAFSSKSRRRHALLAALLAAGGAAGAAPEPTTPVDLSRYLGRWYVIARAPAAEPHPRGAYFEYRAGADGAIDALYSTREGNFEGEAVMESSTARAEPGHEARWTVRQGWFGSNERWVLYVSPDYQYTIAGTPDRGAAWILAREPVIPEWSYAGLLARLALQGYDVSAFRKVPQTPAQLGRPGFE